MFTASQLLILPSSSLMFSVVQFGAFVVLNFEMLLMSVVLSAYKMNLNLHSHDLRVPVGSISRLKHRLPQCTYLAY